MAQQRHDGFGVTFGFPRCYRLTKTDEYSSVFGFRRAIRSPHFFLHYLPTQTVREHARLGVVIGKKQLKRAVHRNLVKRIAREVFRLTRPELPAQDFVLRLAVKLSKTQRAVVRQEMLDLLQRAKRQAQRQQGTPRHAATLERQGK